MSLPSQSPDEERLAFFVGDWDNSGRALPGPTGPGGPVSGSTSYRWGNGGKWLLYTSRLNLPVVGAYEVHGGVIWNSHRGKYDAYAANSLGNLMVYEGEWADDATLVLTLVHPKPGAARVVYRKLPDGVFGMTSENVSADGEFAIHVELGFVRSQP